MFASDMRPDLPPNEAQSLPLLLTCGGCSFAEQVRCAIMRGDPLFDDSLLPSATTRKYEQAHALAHAIAPEHGHLPTGAGRSYAAESPASPAPTMVTVLGLKP
jgi:hypothetical protein